MSSIPAPTNKFLKVMNVIFDSLIEGAGVDLAIAEAEALVPWLTLPIISSIFKQLMRWTATFLEEFAKRNVGKIVIRFQNDARKAEYDSQIEIIKKPGVLPSEVQKARDAMDLLIQRGK